LSKGIIFDFDGVIAESIKLKSDAFGELYKAFGENIVRKVIEHHEANGGMPRFEKIKYYHKSFLKKNLSHKEIHQIANKFSDLVIDKIVASAYVPGVVDYIKKSKKKYKLFISTGTPTGEIKTILNGKKISHYFDEVFGSPEKKKKHIEKIIYKFNIKPRDLIFYGDSNEDLNAAEKTKVPFVLVKNRYNKFLSKNFDGNSINNFIELLK
tara:strand:+ start:63019 stop:63648 length:630 start_codon:yes stop_codon:yes gene_type:complete